MAALGGKLTLAKPPEHRARRLPLNRLGDALALTFAEPPAMAEYLNAEHYGSQQSYYRYLDP
jgi:hypothetical protein